VFSVAIVSRKTGAPILLRASATKTTEITATEATKITKKEFCDLGVLCGPYGSVFSVAVVSDHMKRPTPAL
jgi:hypothetical protein